MLHYTIKTKQTSKNQVFKYQYSLLQKNFHIFLFVFVTILMRLYPKGNFKKITMKKIILSTVLLLIASLAFSQQPTSFQVQVIGKGKPVIMIPGYSCPGEVWKETAEQLKKNYELHIISIAGFGGTPPIESEHLLQTVKEEIIAYTKNNRLKKPSLIGHSLGAFLTLWIQSQAPDLFGKSICVDGLPFLMAMGKPNTTADDVKKMPQFDKKAVVANFKSLPNEGYIENMTKSMLYQVSDSLRAKAIAKWSFDSDRTTLGSTLVELSTTDLRGELAKIKQPNLVLTSFWGTKETSEKEYNLQYALLKNKTIKVAQAKHFIMYDTPEWFYNEIELFLNAKS